MQTAAKACHPERSRGTCFSAGLLALLLLATAFIFPGHAQIHGTPASVTSPGFGGQPGRVSGVPPSVTSLGPNGFGHNFTFRTEPNFPRHPNGPAFPHHPQPPASPLYGSYTYYPFVPVFSIPYPADVYPDDQANARDREQDDGRYSEQYRGGPTIFDRRGPGTPTRNNPGDYRERREDVQTETRQVAQPDSSPVANQPPTVLIFKDGRQAEIANYAIAGGTLFDLGSGRQRKIAIADLDIAETTKQNDDRGVDFQVPASAVRN